jgi:hypothetical protein
MSTAVVESLLERLDDLGVRVLVDGDHLRLRGPEGSVGADLLEEMRANKAELIRVFGDHSYAARANREIRHHPERFTGPATEPAAAVAPPARHRRRHAPTPTPPGRRPRNVPIIESLPEPTPPRARRATAPRTSSPAVATRARPATTDDHKAPARTPGFWDRLLGVE